MTNRLDHRMTTLEQVVAPKQGGLSVIIVEAGETYEQAVARYYAENPNAKNASLKIIIDMMEKQQKDAPDEVA